MARLAQFLCVGLLILLPSCQTFSGTPAGFSGSSGETILLGGNVLTPAAPGYTFDYAFVLDNATNGVHAEGTIGTLQVPYSDAQITNAVAEVSTYESLNRTQNGFPIDPVVTVVTSVYGYDAQGFTSLVLAQGTDGTMKYVTSPATGYRTMPEGGRVEVGLAHSSGPVTLDDGSTMESSFVVTGIEVIDVHYGRFETYRVEETATTNDQSGTTVMSGTLWLHPAVGQVRREFTMRGPNGVATTTIQLVATNMAL